MVSIDERIKQELEQQDGVLDELFPETAMAELGLTEADILSAFGA